MGASYASSPDAAATGASSFYTLVVLTLYLAAVVPILLTRLAKGNKNVATVALAASCAGSFVAFKRVHPAAVAWADASSVFDPYDILQIPSTANATVVKKAYRSLSRTAHPDKGGDAELFRKIQNAHAALAGTQFTLSPGPPWWVSIPRAQWPEGLAEEFQAEEAAAEKAKHEMYLAEQAEQMLAAQLAAPPPAEHALYYYKRAHRAATEEANPEADPAALVQLMEERFEALTAEERAPFEEKAADEQQRTSALAAALQLAQRDATPYSPWDAEHGDRRTELVCIGRELDGEAASAQLEACLLTADEMVLLKEEGWGWLPDPFAPSWLTALDAEYVFMYPN